MTDKEIIEELENMIGLIEQNGKDWLDERDVPMLKQIIELIKGV